MLIGADGYIKITDFGLSKNNIVGDHDSFSVCGTPEYLAPEVIKKEGHGKAVDWWCFGSLIYELMHGLPPFYSKNRGELFEKIKNGEPYYSKNWSSELKDLFKNLFEKNPDVRMQHVPHIRTHSWFAPISFQLLQERKLKPPFVPYLNGDSDISHFAKEFTSCSVESNASSYTDNKKFEGFSFEPSKSPTSPGLDRIEAELDESDEIEFVSEGRAEEGRAGERIEEEK